MANDAESAESAGGVEMVSEQGRQLISSVWKAALILFLLRSVSNARDDVKCKYSGPSAQIMAMQVSLSSRIAMSKDELQRSLIRNMDSSTQAANAGRDPSVRFQILKNLSYATKWLLAFCWTKTFFRALQAFVESSWSAWMCTLWSGAILSISSPAALCLAWCPKQSALGLQWWDKAPCHPQVAKGLWSEKGPSSLHSR